MIRIRRSAAWSQLLVITRLFSIVTVDSPAQESELFRSWNQPFNPFRIIGNVYYVGANEITSFLITTSEGHILIDGGFKETAPIIEANIRSLGFRLRDVKILLNSHAHLDHAGGLARLKKTTGAQLMIMEGDVDGIETGASDSPDFAFPPAKVDKILRDKESVKLGEVVLQAHLTPGHTKGSTTWSMQVIEDGVTYYVVFTGSPNVLPDTDLIKNADYPTIAEDFEKTFRVMRSLKCDVFLGGHGSFFHLGKKAKKLAERTQTNPFIDPEALQRFAERKEAVFKKELQRQRAKS